MRGRGGVTGCGAEGLSCSLAARPLTRLEGPVSIIVGAIIDTNGVQGVLGNLGAELAESEGRRVQPATPRPRADPSGGLSARSGARRTDQAATVAPRRLRPHLFPPKHHISPLSVTSTVCAWPQATCCLSSLASAAIGPTDRVRSALAVARLGGTDGGTGGGVGKKSLAATQHVPLARPRLPDPGGAEPRCTTCSMSVSGG